MALHGQLVHANMESMASGSSNMCLWHLQQFTWLRAATAPYMPVHTLMCLWIHGLRQPSTCLCIHASSLYLNTIIIEVSVLPSSCQLGYLYMKKKHSLPLIGVRNLMSVPWLIQYTIHARGHRCTDTYYRELPEALDVRNGTRRWEFDYYSLV